MSITFIYFNLKALGLFSFRAVLHSHCSWMCQAEFILEWCPGLFPDNPALISVGFFHGNSALTPILPL